MGEKSAVGSGLEKFSKNVRTNIAPSTTQKIVFGLNSNDSHELIIRCMPWL